MRYPKAIEFRQAFFHFRKTDKSVEISDYRRIVKEACRVMFEELSSGGNVSLPICELRTCVRKAKPPKLVDGKIKVNTKVNWVETRKLENEGEKQVVRFLPSDYRVIQLCRRKTTTNIQFYKFKPERILMKAMQTDFKNNSCYEGYI